MNAKLQNPCQRTLQVESLGSTNDLAKRGEKVLQQVAYMRAQQYFTAPAQNVVMSYSDLPVQHWEQTQNMQQTGSIL